MDITPQACCEGAALETHDLGARLHVALDNLFHQKKPADREAVCCHDITHNQWTLLHMLADAEAEPLPMGVIARRMRLTPSGVTRCADPLVERGLIERCMKEGDRRVCCLVLSETGARRSMRPSRKTAPSKTARFWKGSPPRSKKRSSAQWKNSRVPPRSYLHDHRSENNACRR